jgi:sugar lactone lactonase YvrE
MLSNNWMKSWTRQAIGLMMFVVLILFAAEAVASSPSIVASIPTTVTSSGLPPGTNNSVAIDACGNMYAIQGTNNGAVTGGTVYEIPAGGGAAVEVLSGTGTTLNWDTNYSLTTDPSKSYLFLAYGESTNGVNLAVSIPIVNCVPQTKNLAGWNGVWWSYISTLAADSSSNVYMAQSGNTIVMSDPNFKTLTTVLSSSSLNSSWGAITSLAIDSNKNIFLTMVKVLNYSSITSVGLYELPYSSTGYATTPTLISSNYNQPVGVTFDAQGNLYVADAGPLYSSGEGTIYLIPNEQSGGSKALNPSDQYGVVYGIGTVDRVAFDLSGNYYWMNSGNTISEQTPSTVFGSVALGGTVTKDVDLTFNSSVTPATITVVPSGVFTNTLQGTCSATTNAAGSSCTVQLTFAPTNPGVQSGSILLLDSKGNQLATADVSGTGAGAGLSVDPGVVSTFASGYTAPAGAAIDNLGDLFFADSKQNAVLEVPVGQAAAVALGSGFNAPTGVAVDGAGNVYVADTGNSQIVEIPVVNGALSTSAQTVLISSSTTLAGSALSKPAGITVDSLGNLYIADSDNKRVVYVPYVGSWDFSLALTLGSGMSSPSAIAVDAFGNVYVADAGSGDVYELSAPLSAGVQITVASGYNAPSALTVDASGSLFVVDKGNAKVWRIPNISGSLSAASAINVIGQLYSTDAASIQAPYGVAIDPAGNLYVSDEQNAAAYLVGRTSSTQSFGIWTPGTTSGALDYYLENSGNAALTFGTPYYSVSGDTTQFSLVSSETGACSSGASLSSGSSCELESTFSPLTGGGFSETFVLSSNAANAAGQQVTFIGTGASTVATTTTLAVTSPSGAISYDEAVTLTATVSAATGTPSGSVNLVVDGITKQTVSLTDGVASFTLTGGTLPGGMHSLTANYTGGATGNVTYAQSSSATLTLTVQTVATSTGFTFSTVYVNPASQPAGQSITFTATVSSVFAGSPTGTVTFTFTDSGGTNTTGIGTLQPTSSGAFQATYSYTPNAPATGVTYDVVSVVATYGGDTNFAGSSSASASFDVSPANGSVGVTASGTIITSNDVNTTSVSFSSISYGGWNGLVGFSCLASSLPANARCVWNPGQVQVMPSTSALSVVNPPVSLTITIDNPPQTPTAGKLIWWLGGATGLLIFFARRRFARAAWGTAAMLIGMVLLAVSASGLVACNSNGIQYRTPTGTSTITVYASADPFTALPSESTPTPATQTCVSTSTPAVYGPTEGPCTQQSFQISLTVQ